MQARRFEGRIALVTGAASGIGHACAVRLADEGATVVLADRDPEGAARSASLEGSSFTRLDVTEQGGWQDLARDIEARHGCLNVLINCAGIVESGSTASVGTADLAQIRGTISVNFEGAWLGIQAMLPLLSRRGGAIVNMGSRASEAAAPFAAAYAASKAALKSLTRSTALYCASAKLDIRCNIILAGSVDTPMWRPISGDGTAQSREAALATGLPHIPAGRLARAEEVAAAILFLASAEASYINGTSLLVDGGQSCL